MLIACDRHRAADLAAWREMESADLALAATPGHARKVARSESALGEFAGGGPFYVSVSWGKDSVALAGLVAAMGIRVPLVHLRAIPVANPESVRVRDAFLSLYPAVDYREAEVDYRDIPPGADIDTAEREKDRRFFAAFAAAGRSCGPRHAAGVRADESRVRKIRMRRWGLLSPNAAAPIGWWSAADVFAFLAGSGLPVHPNYAMLGGGRWPREHLRVDELAGERGVEFGRREWEREYYGDILRRAGID